MVGGIAKPRLFRRAPPDARALAVLARVGKLRDDLLLRGLADELERDGIRIVPSTMFLAGDRAHGRRPRRAAPRPPPEWADIRFGFRVAKVIGQLRHRPERRGAQRGGDRGRGDRGHRRDHPARRQLANGDIVVVKVCKPTQDLRFDLPAVGPETIRTLAEVRGRALAVEAGRTIALDRARDDRARRRGRHRECVAVDPTALARRGTGCARVQLSGARSPWSGSGTSGRFHAEKYAAHPGRRAGRVVRRRRRSRAGGSRPTLRRRGARPTHRALLGRIDCASVAVPTQHHHAVARDLLAAGIDVLVEKPLTSHGGRGQVAGRARRARPGACCRSATSSASIPPIRALDGLVTQPRFIECHRLAPFTERGTDVDVVLDLMIHDLDVILSMVPSPSARSRRSASRC